MPVLSVSKENLLDYIEESDVLLLHLYQPVLCSSAMIDLQWVWRVVSFVCVRSTFPNVGVFVSFCPLS